MPEELVILSGKGGTGKTSLTAAFAVLAETAVVADCDVDASDLHLLLAPGTERREQFFSGHEAVIDQSICQQCGVCHDVCRFDAVRIEMDAAGTLSYHIDLISCEGCGVCVRLCPDGAIDFPESHCGEWMVSRTRCGPMVHARLGIAAENSGKLVSIVRREARAVAEAEGRNLLIVDGPPGIGCPVIATLTGATKVLFVTEPTVSGEHDLARILSLANHFGLPVALCVNKWDINPGMTEQIEQMALDGGVLVAGRIPYDPGVTAAQVGMRTIVETDCSSGESVRQLWQTVRSFA
jgi:MinD superfamily P-loop ATPase